MKLKILPPSLFSHFAYIGTGLLSVVLAAILAKSVLSPIRAQEQAEPAKEDVPLPPPPALLDVNEAADVTAANVGESSVFLEPYIYDVRDGRRNPFSPPAIAETVGDVALAGPTGPLERYELDDLKLIAIMWNVKKPRAMIIDPNKIVHTAYKDERIGRRRGYIAVIRESELVVVEPSSFDGETVYSTRILRVGE